MSDGTFTSHDVETTELLGAMCRGCGHRGGQHRPAHPIADKPACPGPAYDPADVAIYRSAHPEDEQAYPTA